MLSMLAKYIPGGVWTPTARVVALRRFGVKDTPVVLRVDPARSRALRDRRGAGLPRRARAHRRRGRAAAAARRLRVLVGFLLYPPVFEQVARRLLRPFGAEEVTPLPARTAFALLGFYALTWPLGGAGLFFMLRSVGGDPAVSTIPYLGGVSAVGAIVAVLHVFAPSGHGVREASMYGLLLAGLGEDVALERDGAEPACDHARRGDARCSRRGYEVGVATRDAECPCNPSSSAEGSGAWPRS